MPRCGIYAIINCVNHSCYVGSAVDFQVRKARHLNELRQGKHHSRYLQNAYNKYGKAVFCFIFLEDVAKDKKLLHQREGHWIQFLRPEYNVGILSATALGAKRTEVTRHKIAEKATGRTASEETRQKQAERKRGTTRSEEANRKTSESLKVAWQENPRSEEVRRKSGEGYKVFWASLSEEEQQARVAKNQAAHGPVSEVTHQRMSLAKKGKKQSPEAIKNRTSRNIGSKRSEETRANMRAAQQDLAARRKAAKQQQTNTQPPLFNL